MTYLVDTNIFLEIFLGQPNKLTCKDFLEKHAGSLYISDFSLHSIGVLLFKRKKYGLLSKFNNDRYGKIFITSLPWTKLNYIEINAVNFNLDFDDAYQYTIAKIQNFSIATQDKDFKRVKDIDVYFIDQPIPI